MWRYVSGTTVNALSLPYRNNRSDGMSAPGTISKRSPIACSAYGGDNRLADRRFVETESHERPQLEPHRFV